MELQKIVGTLTKMLNSDKWKVQCRCRHITKVEIHYDDNIIITIKDKPTVQKQQ